MEYSIVNSQLTQLKFNLVNDIRQHIGRLSSNSIVFNKNFFYVDSNNPDLVYSIYGIENGVILHDTFYQGVTTFDLQDLSIEGLLHIKNEIDLYEKNQLIIKNLSN